MELFYSLTPVTAAGKPLRVLPVRRSLLRVLITPVMRYGSATPIVSEVAYSTGQEFMRGNHHHASFSCDSDIRQSSYCNGTRTCPFSRCETGRKKDGTDQKPELQPKTMRQQHLVREQLQVSRHFSPSEISFRRLHRLRNSASKFSTCVCIS